MSTKGPTQQMLKRMLFILMLFLLPVCLVCGSLVNITILKGPEYQQKATEQQLYDARLTAERGDIYDSNMNLLATSAPVWTVFVTPNAIASISNESEKAQVKNAIIVELSEILELEKEDVANDIEKTSSYYVAIKRKVEKDVTDKVREFITKYKDISMSAYIGLDEATKRYYPNQELASTVLGFVGDDNQGLSGLELQYDEELTGTPGRIVSAKNAHGNAMTFTYEKKVDSTPGNSLVSTIDSYMQYVAEKYLNQAVVNNKPAERGAVVIMNVKTGAIKAMATKGDFNPNSPFVLSESDQAEVDKLQGEERTKLLSDLRNRQWRNKTISDAYEPGSVFKVITEAIALEEGLTNVNHSFNCTGTIFVAGQKYNCHKDGGHGVQNLSKATQNSCNPFFISLGQTIGVNTFSKYFDAFGLTSKTGIDLPGEATSQYYSEKNMGPVELASASFGQTFKVTPIQLLTALSSTVNGGYLVEPHVVSKIIDSDKNVVKNFDTKVKRQVISKETSKIICGILEDVVAVGGGKNAYVAGYRIGGKTGTSQKVREMQTTGQSGLYVASFAGFAPMDDPELAVLVIIDEPTGNEYYGGNICAPVGGQIFADILPYLGYEPKYTEDELKTLAITVPNVVGKSLSEAKNILTNASLKYSVVGQGNTITKQLPGSTQSIYKNGVVILYTEENPTIKKVKVPNLLGCSISEVNSIATNAGLNVTFKGNTLTQSIVVSYSQSIKAGTEVDEGSVIEVYFRSYESGDMTH